MKHSKKQISAMLAAAILSMAAATTVSAASRVGDDDLGGKSNATVEFTGGTIKLDKVPELDFGSHGIAAEAEAYAADSVSDIIQVSDLRGTGEGWDLMVSLSNFHHASDNAVTLKGAKIQISNPVVKALNGTTAEAPAVDSEITLSSGNVETLLLKAGDNEGMGVWGLEWKAAETKLLVNPGTARTGKSIATLTWSLQTTP